MSKSKFSFKDFYEKRQVWIHLLLVAIVAVVLGWLSVLFMDFWTNHGRVEIVPNVVGLNYKNASDILEAKDFEVEIDSIYDKQAKYGQVLAQSPKANEVVKYGRTIYLKINSTYPEIVAINEDLLHVSSMQAQNMLVALGFSRIRINEIVGDNDDEVVDVRSNGRQITVGAKLPVTSEIVLTVTYTPTQKMYVDTLSVDMANLLLNDSILQEKTITEITD